MTHLYLSETALTKLTGGLLALVIVVAAIAGIYGYNHTIHQNTLPTPTPTSIPTPKPTVTPMPTATLTPAPTTIPTPHPTPTPYIPYTMTITYSEISRQHVRNGTDIVMPIEKGILIQIAITSQVHDGSTRELFYDNFYVTIDGVVVPATKQLSGSMVINSAGSTTLWFIFEQIGSNYVLNYGSNMFTIKWVRTQDNPHYFILKSSFHTHTNRSDGAYNASYLVDLYDQAGYDCIAITDHDDIGAWNEAKTEGERLGLIIIQGQEVSTSWPDGTPRHVLALFINGMVVVRNYTSADPEPIFDSIHALGGLGEIAHPEIINTKWESTFLWNATKWYPFWNADYVDGIQWSPNWPEGTEVPVLSNGDFITYNHDFHGDRTNPFPPKPLPEYFTYVFASERSEWGVRDALEHQRTVCVSGESVVGTEEALGLYETLVNQK